MIFYYFPIAQNTVNKTVSENFYRGVYICMCMCTCFTIVLLLRSAVGNVSGYRCVSDCRSRGREFDPGPVPYFRGD